MEVSGRAGLFSINFDTILAGSFYLGGGFSHWRTATATESVSVTIIPIYINFYFLEGLHRIFATFAQDIVLASNTFDAYGFKSTGLTFLPGLGYEYRPEGGFLLRGALYYMFGANTRLLTSGLSIGYTF
ncbi:MAG: hypothetical protein IPM57_05805 [Oligoflexia bacterium]|nr:hypothetical protein [Oligoflexia bacterium]